MRTNFHSLPHGAAIKIKSEICSFNMAQGRLPSHDRAILRVSSLARLGVLRFFRADVGKRSGPSIS